VRPARSRATCRPAAAGTVFPQDARHAGDGRQNFSRPRGFDFSLAFSTRPVGFVVFDPQVGIVVFDFLHAFSLRRRRRWAGRCRCC